MTPEARRDRAAILRRDGVAPASGRVLAASFLPCPLHLLALSYAYLQAGEKWEVKSPWENSLLWNFSPARLRADADAVQTSQPVRSP